MGRQRRALPPVDVGEGGIPLPAVLLRRRRPVRPGRSGTSLPGAVARAVAGRHGADPVAGGTRVAARGGRRARRGRDLRGCGGRRGRVRDPRRRRGVARQPAVPQQSVGCSCSSVRSGGRRCSWYRSWRPPARCSASTWPSAALGRAFRGRRARRGVDRERGPYVRGGIGTGVRGLPRDGGAEARAGLGLRGRRARVGARRRLRRHPSRLAAARSIRVAPRPLDGRHDGRSLPNRARVDRWRHGHDPHRHGRPPTAARDGSGSLDPTALLFLLVPGLATIFGGRFAAAGSGSSWAAFATEWAPGWSSRCW